MDYHFDLQRRQQNGGTSNATTVFGSASASMNGTTTPMPSIPLGAAAGGITITMPPVESTSYYKLAPSEYVTFGWNFTGVSVTPTAITVAAVGANSDTYYVGPTDGVIPGNAQSVVWYPYGYQTANPSIPLVQGSYTLHIWASGGPSAAPTPGYLAPNSELIFAIYTTEAYTPLNSGWQCVDCSGALPQIKLNSAFSCIIAMVLIMLLSGFTTLRRALD